MMGLFIRTKAIVSSATRVRLTAIVSTKQHCFICRGRFKASLLPSRIKTHGQLITESVKFSQSEAGNLSNKSSVPPLYPLISLKVGKIQTIEHRYTQGLTDDVHNILKRQMHRKHQINYPYTNNKNCLVNFILLKSLSIDILWRF